MQTERSDFELRMPTMRALEISMLQKENTALKAKNIELTGNLSATTLSINNVSDAMGLNGDGPFSLQVITKFTDLLADNETLRAMVHEMTTQRYAHGWTNSNEANSALVMLGRIDTTDPCDDDRIEAIRKIIHRMASALDTMVSEVK